MTGGYTLAVLQVPSVVQPKSKPAMLTPANLTLPVAVDVDPGAVLVVLALTLTVDVCTVVGVAVAVPGTHWA